MDLTGRVALVTGAGRRVGRALALALAGRGATVAVHYGSSESDARSVAKEIESGGGTAALFQADLTLPESPDRLIERVTATLGSLAVLVNSAAIMERTPLGEVEVATWDRIFALNLRAPFFLMQAAAPHLKRARGVVVNIADLGAYETWPGYVPHTISKAGVVHMTRSLARVLAPDVRVNAVAPGTVLLPDDWRRNDEERLNRTTPLGRLGSPGDVASAMLFLIDSDYITGETIIVDGGRHVRG